MAITQRYNLAVTITPAGGDNPLTMRLKMNKPILVGIVALGALVAKGGTEPYAYAITAGSLPAGLSLDSATGKITGTPAAVGKTEFIAEVQDSSASPFIFACTFEIDVDHNLQVFAANPPALDHGLVYSYLFGVSGNTGHLSYSTLSALPRGITLSSDGLLSGTVPNFPFGGATYPLTIDVSDSGTGDAISFDVDLVDSGFWQLTSVGNVGSVGQPLVIGTTYSGLGTTVFYINGTAPVVRSYDLTNIPWARYEAITGTFKGTPTTAGTFAVPITLTDAIGNTLTSTFNVIVIAPNALIQPMKNGAAVSTSGATNYDFRNVRSVANDGTTVTIDVGGGSGATDIGTLSLTDGFVLQYKRLTLSGTERLTLAGTSRVVLSSFGADVPLCLGTPKAPRVSFIIKDDYFIEVRNRLTLARDMRATLQGNANLLIGDDFGAGRSRIVLSGSSI